MDRRERSGSPATALLAALDGWQAGVWTAFPAVVTAFDPAERTVSLQPIIQVRAQNPDGTFEWVTIPQLLNCPVVFPGGGGVTLTFPIKPGDEGLAVIASRCIDAWWQLGGHVANDPTPTPQVQMEFRMHDLSDGFYVAGLNSKPLVIPAISATTAQLRSDTGLTYIEVDPGDGFVNVITPGNIVGQAGGNITAEAGGNINATAGGNISASAGGDITATAGGDASVTAPGQITLTAPSVIVNGHLTVNGPTTLNGPISQGHGGGGTNASLIGPLNVDTTATVGGVGVTTHHHGGVQPGGSNTGGPAG